MFLSLFFSIMVYITLEVGALLTLSLFFSSVRGLRLTVSV